MIWIASENISRVEQRRQHGPPVLGSCGQDHMSTETLDLTEAQVRAGVVHAKAEIEDPNRSNTAYNNP